MMPPSDIRPGDLITIEMVVKNVNPDHLVLNLKPLDVAVRNSDETNLAICYGAIAKHKPAYYEPDMSVIWYNMPAGLIAKIVHVDIHNDKAWVKCQQDSKDGPIIFHDVISLSELALRPAEKSSHGSTIELPRTSGHHRP